MDEAIRQHNELAHRENLLEEMVDCCLNDIAECRSRIADLERQRMEIIVSIIETAKLSKTDELRPITEALRPLSPPSERQRAETIVGEVLRSSSPFSLREAIRQCVCVTPGTYSEIAARLNVTPKQVSAPLSKLHQSGQISKQGRIFGPPGGWSETISGTA